MKKTIKCEGCGYEFADKKNDLATCPKCGYFMFMRLLDMNNKSVYDDIAEESYREFQDGK